jgi:hypothetical protein
MSDVEGIVGRLRQRAHTLDNARCPVTFSGALDAEAADEIERLNAALQYEQHRSGRIGTHGVGCWAWGPQHYECALSELQSRDATISRLEGANERMGRLGSAIERERDEAVRDLAQVREERDAAEAEAAQWKADAAAEFLKRQKAEAALGEAVKVVERLTGAAKLLQANSEGCAVNHYGEDFGLHGVPGFLIDTQADIEAARTFLSKQEGGK